jgi:single-stranded DNA-specific DHH superfamily exonuclease
MALTQEEIDEIRKAIDESARPLFFFDDDPDGACSFMLLYKYKGEGKGVIIKASPELKEEYYRKVEEYQPDLVVILDKPLVQQELLDRIKCKTIWIDHHEPVKRHNVHYFNPRKHDDKDNRPTTYWAYKIANKKEDLWLAVLGCIGDWFLPDFIDEFREQYPGLIPETIKTADDATYETDFGKLVRILSFDLKLSTSDALKAIKVMLRISSPEEILKRETPQGRYLIKMQDSVNKSYDQLLAGVTVRPKDPLLVYIYKNEKFALTKDLSNELIHKYPKKIIIIGREKDNVLKLSLRSTSVALPALLKEAVSVTRDGYGGGHTFACGAQLSALDKEAFLLKIREYLKKQRHHHEQTTH